MQTLTAKDAKYGFGRLMDLARAEPVTIAKHGRAVVVVMSVEETRRKLHECNTFLNLNVTEEEGERLRMTGMAVA